MTTHDPRLDVREGETYEQYAARFIEMGSHGHPDVHPGNSAAAGADVDRRAREILAARGVVLPDYRLYRDAVVVADAELAGAR
jgi:hypothetical protein